ncbi:MAG: DNA polymerase III subunit delta', partial [Alphaproteobacteria bacterium]
ALAPAEAEVVAALAGGSAGTALRLAAGGGAEIARELLALFAAAPGMPRARMLAFARRFAGREGAEALGLALDLAETILARAARSGAGHPPEPMLEAERQVAAALAPDAAAARRLAGALPAIMAAARAGRAVNLDPPALVVDMLRRIDALAPARRRA